MNCSRSRSISVLRSRDHARTLTLLLSALACSSTSPSDGRAIGVVSPGLAGVPVIEAPDTVQAGFPFVAVINTFGSSGCTSPAEADVRLSPAVATVTPYDVVAPDGVACTRDYASRAHPVRVTFTDLGPACIVVRGVSTGGTPLTRTSVTITKDIYVIR